SRYWQADIASHRAYAGIVLRALRIHVELLVQRWGSLARSVERAAWSSIYVIPSQLHIERPRPIERLKQGGKLKLVYVVHDILPPVFPEYFPPDAEDRCRRRMQAAARIADIVVAVSNDTARAFRKNFAEQRDPRSVVVAPLGVGIGRRLNTASHA